MRVDFEFLLIVMADSLHWLTSKQGDSWTSSSIGPLLTPERLNLLLDDYSSLDTSTKTCLLLAIANLSPRAIKTNAKQLYQVTLLFDSARILDHILYTYTSFQCLLGRLFAGVVKTRSNGCV